ncbi:phage tail fiber protein [Paenibacillus timonensis]|uniref:phage tail fiber protein n=1 Tax=Paenibacillus timonensis TaxID=225915 RepID=UPI003F9B1A48
MADEILLSKSNYWKTACLNAALRGVPFTPPSKVYIALYTSDPTDADTGQEITGGGYARVQVTFSQPVISARRAVTSNNADVAFPIAKADQGIASYVGIRDALSGGNLLYHGALKKPRSILENDLIRFLTGQFVMDEG